MAPLYLLTALSCAAIAWQPYQRTDLWEWMVWAARSAPYQNGDEERDEIARISALGVSDMGSTIPHA
jgi:hypothetical protein